MNPHSHDRTALAGAVFAAFDRAGLHWCLVGDDRSVAAGFDNDLDLVVARRDIARVPALLRRFARDQGIDLVQDIQHEVVARFFIFTWSETNGRPEFLYVDVCSDWVRQGRRFVPASLLLRERMVATAVAADGRVLRYWRPAPADNFLYYLLKKLDKRALNPDQAKFLAQEWRRDPVGSRARLDRWLPPAAATMVAASAAADDWTVVHAALPALARTLRDDGRLGGWLPLAETVRRLWRWLRPTGLFVQLGPGTTDAELDLASGDWARAFRRVRVLRSRERIGYWRYWREVRPLLVRSTLVLVAAPAVAPGLAHRPEVLLDNDCGGLRPRLRAALAGRLVDRRYAHWIPLPL